ncbi:MAG TPA: DsbA family protein [Magnetospirillaceae bacterium]
MTDKQQEAVKKVVHDYLIEHPEVMMEAIQAYREKEKLAEEEEAKKAVSQRADALNHDPNSVVLGNPDGDVTVVEFFDYHCPYCKAMADSTLDVVKSDGKVRLVMKELPILGPDSVLASRAAIASRKQHLYTEFHQALLHLKGPLNEGSVMQTAAAVGINVDKLKKDMNDPEVDSIISANLDLAHAINVDGTPGWVVGDKVQSGAMSPQSFKQMIDEARKPKT